jgi:beta-xylosidase
MVNGAWGATYSNPRLPAPPRSVKSPTGTDRFTTSALSHEWEWNHNPDRSRWSAGNGLRLLTATVTVDLYSARNTLTRRILGPSSTATMELEYSAMQDGDRTGLALFRDSSAWVGIARDTGTCRVAVVSGITMTSTWTTQATGSYIQASSVPCTGKIWLRASADIRPQPVGVGRFSYSFDGNSFTSIGGTFAFKADWRFFLGYRFAIFNYATRALGGSVTVSSFTMSQP